MDIPGEKKPSSPATGAAARAAAPVAPASRPPVKEDEDLQIGDEVFSHTVISLPPRASRKDPPKDVFKDLNPPPPDVKEVEERTSRKKPLEKRSGQAPNFKRLFTRPETAFTANAALDQARAESPASMEKIEHGSMQFGKIHPHSSPDYRPNRLLRVLDGIYTHSPLKWLDFVDRTGARFLAGLLLFIIVGGVVAWRYFGSFAGRDSTSAGGAKSAALSTSERVERGRAAVKEFLAAQTIEARLPYVLDPGRTVERMRQFYDTMQGRNPATVEWEVGEPVPGEHGAWLPFTFKDTAGRKVTVVMGEDDSGCRIDWENFVAFGEAPWQEYCRTRPSTPKSLRVRLRRVEKYEGTYAKENWQSYEIEHRSGPPALLGYASRTGRTGQALDELVSGEGWQAALVYLRFDAGASGGLVVIDDVIRTRWQDEVTSWTNP